MAIFRGLQRIHIYQILQSMSSLSMCLLRIPLLCKSNITAAANGNGDFNQIPFFDLRARAGNVTFGRNHGNYLRW